MTWWKVKYSFRRPHWWAFGHILYVTADDHTQAEHLARARIADLEPGAEITHLDVTAATAAQQQRHAAKVEAYRQWLTNVAQGVPNQRGDL